MEAKDAGRDAVGCKAGVVGLGGNLALFLVKLSVGYASNSIAVLADALNNLTDCAAAVVTILGFRFARREKDEMHPYGHGRMEYICGFMIANAILLTAFSVGRDSVLRLLEPQRVCLSAWQQLLLLGSVAAKLLMAWYVASLNGALRSPALTAVRNDNLSDALVTAAALLAFHLSPHSTLPLDGILGLLVSLSILWSGASSFRENLALLLGAGADAETKRAIREIVLEYPLFAEVESITMHDYGPEEKVVFVKVTLRQSPHSHAAAEALRQLKARLAAEMRLQATLYWDAVEREPRESASPSPAS